MKSITSIYLLGDKNKGKIGRIKEISNEITFYWNKIKEENVIPKEAKRNYDLKALLQKIETLSEERILLKLYMQCINMGYKKFTELPKDNNYLNIFTLCEKTEQLFHLSKIKTLDPKLKRSKGKKNLDKTEELTSAYIAGLKINYNQKLTKSIKILQILMKRQNSILKLLLYPQLHKYERSQKSNLCKKEILGVQFSL